MLLYVWDVEILSDVKDKKKFISWIICSFGYDEKILK